MSGVRDRLDDECTDCGKSIADADEIAPVTRGRYSLGPDWYCGGCLTVVRTDGGTTGEFSAVERPIPFDNHKLGEECTECGQTIRPDAELRMCHSCRVRPHEALVRRITRQILYAADDHSTRTSINLAVNKRLFQELRHRNGRDLDTDRYRTDGGVDVESIEYDEYRFVVACKECGVVNEVTLTREEAIEDAGAGPIEDDPARLHYERTGHTAARLNYTTAPADVREMLDGGEPDDIDWGRVAEWLSS